MNLITVYTTHPDLKIAKKIAAVLLKKHLVACVTFYPIEASFWWKGKINHTKEVVALLTTQESHWNKIEKEIKKLHPYEVPCIEKTKFTATKEYESWVKLTTK